MGAGVHGGFGSTKGAKSSDIKSQLPNSNKAIIPESKIYNYALDYEKSKGKAEVFKQTLGFDKTNGKELIKQVKNKVNDYPAKIGMKDKYGQRYTVEIPIKGINGKTKIVKTAWIIKPNGKVPTLITIYVK